MKQYLQMKKDLGFSVSLILFFISVFFSEICFADDIILPDFRLKADKRKEKTEIFSNKIKYQSVRNNQSFDKFFDSLIIEIYTDKPENTMKPSYFGNTYLAKKGFCDNKFEKYILEDNDNEFFAIWCSEKSERCEIIRVLNGFDGLVNIKYVHNNLWHFQNNIGFFVEIVRSTRVLPYETAKRNLTRNRNFVRL